MTDSVWRLGGRYRVVDRIGSGGMADVMRAHDELLDRDVAVKVFRSAPSTPDTAVGVERQQAELRALARLNHPNLTVLFDGAITGQDGPAYLVMELIDGPSLAEEIEAGPMPPTRVAEVGAQVADALAYVHAAGMVHRDVKPANVLLGSDRIAESDWARARLTDFGIVRLVGDEPLTRADMTLGSASYLAPEQTRGSSVGPPADVYALGLTLLEALTGRRSFEGPALEAAMARLTKDPEIPPGLPAPWPDLLRAMTARDPQARPSATRVAKVLRGTESTAAALAAVPAYPVVPPADERTALIDRQGTGLLPAGMAYAGSATGATSVIPPPMPPVRRPAESGAWEPAGPPPPVDRRRTAMWVAAGIAAVLVILAIVLAVVLTAGSGGGSGASNTPTTPAPSTSAAKTTSSAATSTSSAPTTSAASSTSSAPTTSAAPSTSASSSTSAPSSSASSATSASTSPSSASSSASTPAAAGPPAASTTAPAGP